MKPLLKIMLSLGLVFVALFVLLNATGLISLAKIEAGLQAAKAADPLYVGLAVAVLLFADLFFSIPTMATLMLAGYFIGPLAAAAAGSAGMMAAGLVGYGLSRRYGEAATRLIVHQANDRDRAAAHFRRHGSVVILLARAVPMLPEVAACMAGLTRMPVWKFLGLWTANVVPYAAIAAYAGARSTLDDPTPAVYAALGLIGFFWSGWLIFNRRSKKP